MLKKIISFIKYNSYIIIPVFASIILWRLDKKTHILINVPDEKITVLMDIITALIGVLLTILTIYLSFPKEERTRRRMTESGHNHILICNILTGVIIFVIALVVWLFSTNSNLVIYLFIAGLCNVIITGYYIFVLSRYS